MDFLNSFIPVSIKYDFVSENQGSDMTKVSNTIQLLCYI